MTVGLLTLELRIRGSRSLKDKRAVLRRVKERLRGRLNVSVAETEFHDDHQRSVVAVAAVSSDAARAEEVLDHAEQETARLVGDDLIRADRERL
jgi:uncharacterized protein YlxP (DUF503 family)